MKKSTSIVLAAAALNAVAVLPVMAQSSVTMNGFLNLGVGKTTGSTVSEGTISRSNLAFSGKEDLGGGLSATFRLSARFELDTGTTENGNRPFFQGESTVGLKDTTLGSLRLGRSLSPISSNDGSFDAWGVFDRTASPGWWFFIPDYVPDPGVGNLANPHDYGRIANGIFYDSADLGGFNFHLSTAAGECAQAKARHYGVSLNYDKNNLDLMLGAEQNSQRDRAYFAGAAYRMGPVKLMGGYSLVKLNPDGWTYSNDWTGWASASNPRTRRTSFVGGAEIDIGVSAILLGFGRDFQGSTNAFNIIGSTFKTVGTNYSGASNFYGAGYIYNFSKRTSVFADVALIDWKYTDDNGRTRATSYSVGINHAF